MNAKNCFASARCHPIEVADNRGVLSRHSHWRRRKPKAKTGNQMGPRVYPWGSIWVFRLWNKPGVFPQRRLGSCRQWIGVHYRDLYNSWQAPQFRRAPEGIHVVCRFRNRVSDEIISGQHEKSRVPGRKLALLRANDEG